MNETRAITARTLDPLRAALPGLALAAVIAAAAMAFRALPGMATVSPLILAIVIGIGLRNIFGLPAVLVPGIKASLKRVLRAGIVLLGLQLTLGQVIAVGAPGLLVVVATLAATFVFTLWLGWMLGVDRPLTELMATGTSVCGASAVIAANTVSEGTDEDVAYAVAAVTVFGSIAMLTYPWLGEVLGLKPLVYGLWTGATVHEVAQVVAAGFQAGTEAGELSTIVKLSRVVLLAPVVIVLGLMAARRHGASKKGKAPTPWFVAGFLLMIGINSAGLLPAQAHAPLVAATPFLLAMGMAAMGLETDVRRLAAKGLRPLALGAGSALFIAAAGLGLVSLL
ncbi:Putative membrane protein YeiH [Caenispirillum salinarum AK4]|uniref:Putative membrane protein YeiH n=1 Tax=Caenispirillum salinarum AK4 TaxID=1238182 RepID=K9GNN1_9PROT|nr:putative sulfate exporter family transporter [Caenispirillum salinarum]EKV26687.1 Putative membrane protein YeiH [Caenispirillum salinarum AK4]